jgi:hypothetical protein
MMTKNWQHLTTDVRLKDFSFWGEEMESLGNRLDAARHCLSEAKSQWAKSYWQETVDRLLFRWKCLPALHDGQAKLSTIDHFRIDYDWWETHQELGSSIFDIDRIFDHFGRFRNIQKELNQSWDQNRANRLARLQ